MPRNPSELARLEDEYEYYRAIVISPNYTKEAREKALVEARKLEKLLGIESKPYNNSEFTSPLPKR